MKYFCFFLISLFLAAETSVAADANGPRSGRRLGFNLGANQFPPGLYGTSIGFNFTDWMQLEAGAGFNSQGVGETFAQEIGTTMTTAIFFIMTIGLIDWDKIRDFVSDDPVTAKTVFSYGGGLNFFYPGWNLSPMLGFGYAGWEAKNQPFNLPNRDNHFFTKLGIDWQSESGFHLNVGWMHADELSGDLKDKLFAQLGFFFRL